MEWLTKLITDGVNLLVGTIEGGSYPAIIILMAIESSLIPLPSEVVMIPAGYLVYQGKMGLVAVILAGIVGSIIGSFANYWLARAVGRPFLKRYGHRMFLPPNRLAFIEKFFHKHGEITIFVSRLIPGMRHIISIPAGLTRMSQLRFFIYTTLGAGIWCVILTIFGYWVGSMQMHWQAAWEKYHNEISICIFIGLFLTIATYIYYHHKRGLRNLDT